jgi:hypothetical protein
MKMIHTPWDFDNIGWGRMLARLIFPCFLFALLICALPARAATTITREAESGSRTAPMVIGSDPESSGGNFVMVPQGSGDNLNDATFGGPGEVRFSINVPEAGRYTLWARALAPRARGEGRSFYVTGNGTNIREWRVRGGTTWKWGRVARLSLPAGMFNLAFRQRDDGTMLDLIILTSEPRFNPGRGQRPAVNAGPDQTVTLPDSAILNGMVTDDGLPLPARLTTTWSQLRGPGTVTFGNANALDTTASFSAPGRYVLRLTANDGLRPVADNVNITVNGTSSSPVRDFTLIVLPDTQFYSRDLSPIFSAQTQWIVNNKASRNIVYVAHLGDCVENGNSFTAEWDHADAAMSLIENPDTTGLLHGIPYGIAVGNHDQTPGANPNGSSTQLYNTYFGTRRFSGRNYYGGHFGSNNDNHFSLFSASGLDFIVIYLEFDLGANPTVLAWADNLLKAHVNRRAIIVSHYITEVGNPAPFGAQGQAIYNALRGNANLFLMLSGHRHGEGRRTDTLNGNAVHTLISDFQERANGGDGWLRILEFSPANNQIRVRTYSPTLNRFETDADSQFTLAYDMTPGSALPPVARVASDQTITLPNSATLSAKVTQPRKPSSPEAVATRWTKVSGPGEVRFDNPNALNTTASFSEAGPYLLQLTADDGLKAGSADMTVLVNPQTAELVTLDVEAESGTVAGPMTIRPSGAASGGQFVTGQEGSNNFNAASDGTPGQLDLSFNIPQGGNYALWARMLSGNGGGDAFYVTSGNTVISEWLVPQTADWQWHKIAEVFVAAGALNLEFRQSHDGAQLDRVIMTNDPQFVP